MNNLHWQRYHQQGLLSTCPTAADSGYDKEIALVWQEFFAALPNEAKIVDLATGNGAVAVLAIDVSLREAKHFTVYGTDLADINPVKTVSLQAERLKHITFYGNTASEQLPFTSKSIDAVTAQYGLEYSDPTAIFVELQRVLKPKSQCQFVIHHASSTLVLKAKASLTEAALLLAADSLFSLLAQALTVDMAKKAIYTHKFSEKFNQFNEQLPSLRAEGGGELLSAMLAAFMQLVSRFSQINHQQLLSELDALKAELTANMLRLQDLLNRAKTEHDMQELIALAKQQGFTTKQLAPLYHDKINLVAWLWQLDYQA